MGWDAYAHDSNAERVAVEWHGHARGTEPELKDPALKAAFGAAATRVKAERGNCDWLLPLAGLDLSGCGKALERATGRSVYDEHGWDPDEVKILAASAVWPENPPREEAYYDACARAFLETCAAQGLGVQFSW